MSGEVEVYVEMAERSKRAALAFFDAVLPEREELRDGYEVPDFAAATRVHSTPGALLLDLEVNKTGWSLGADGVPTNDVHSRS